MADDRQSLDSLLPLVYQELRRLAASYLRRERPGQTLQPTALVHEAYLRLMKDRPDRWQNRAHFCAIAAHSMRQILIERARARGALRSAAACRRASRSTRRSSPAASRSIDLLALDEALERLAALDPEQARLVELRFFGGLTVEETAEAMDISPATVKRHWADRARLAGARAGGQLAGVNAERWQQVNALFHAALEPRSRSATRSSQRQPRRDPELAREVQSLLARHRARRAFLEAPAWTRRAPT